MARGWGLSLSVVFLLGGSVVASAQQDFSKVEITSEKLAEGVYMLQGAGGNIGLSVGADAAFLIDDQYAPLTPKIKAAVAAPRPRLRPGEGGQDPRAGHGGQAAGGARREMGPGLLESRPVRLHPLQGPRAARRKVRTAHVR
jgi:hypothetical protein